MSLPRKKVRDLVPGDVILKITRGEEELTEREVADVSIIRRDDDSDTGQRRIYLVGEEVVPPAMDGDIEVSVIEAEKEKPGMADLSTVVSPQVFSDDFVEKEVAIRHVLVKAYCPCGGQLRTSGQPLLMSLPPKFPHACSDCDEVKHLTKSYPFVRTLEV